MFNMTPEDLRLLAGALDWAYGEGWGNDDPDTLVVVEKARAEADKIDQAENLRSDVPAVTEALTAAAEAFPEQRTGQILSNALGYNDPFHVEDDRLCELIYKYIEEYKND
jgi:hypothetical protein